MYCRNCGKEIAEQAEICVSCGVSPRKGDKREKGTKRKGDG